MARVISSTATPLDPPWSAGQASAVLGLVDGLNTEELLSVLARSAGTDSAGVNETSAQLLAALRDTSCSLRAKTVLTSLLTARRKELTAAGTSAQPVGEPSSALQIRALLSRLVEQLERSATVTSDGRFIQLAYETVLSRGCHPRELAKWQLRLDRQEATRQSMLAELFVTSVKEAEGAAADEANHDPHVLYVMGTGERVTLADWQARAELLRASPRDEDVEQESHARFELTKPPRLAVTAITSLYRGGRHIRRFMENITRQTCFADYAELIIVDANSPDGEADVIQTYLAKHPNVRYLRLDDRVGIYEAWNRAIEQARGEYITCTNVDDLRREDSLELQMTTLDALPFADVVYQDFYYTFDPDLTYEEVARIGVRARLPLVTRHTLLDSNPPHNAPMWRKRLHDELGLFDTRYQSAGDYDFWMRCVAAEKVFFKLNDPHVVYYQNPDGLSTRPGTRGFAETREVHRRRDREVVSELLAMPYAEFCRKHLQAAPGDGGPQDRSRQCDLALGRCASALKYSQAARVAA